MRLTIPCEGNEKIQQLLNILQSFNFNHLKLEINSNNLDQDSRTKLLKELNELQIEFQEAQEDEDDADDGDDDLLNSSTFTFNSSISHIHKKDIITKSIQDKYIYRFFCNRKFKGNLCTIGEKNGIDINIDSTNYKLTFRGPENAINDLMKTISAMHYEKSNPMLYSEAQCLKSTSFIRSKRDGTILDMRVIPEAKGENYQIVVYGHNKAKVEKVIKAINKVSGNIFPLLDISSKYEYSNEAERILEYLKFTCHNKSKKKFEEKKIPHPEILMIEDKKFDRNIFFMFVKKCSPNSFRQIKDWFDKDMASLCLLNIKMESDQKLPITITNTSEEEKINTFKLKDNSLLLIGKEKAFLKSLKDILAKESTEKIVTQYKLRFKKLFRSELLSTQTTRKAFPIDEYTENCNPLVVKPFNDRSVYVFCLLPRWQDLEKLLKAHQNLLKNTSWSSSHKSSPSFADSDSSHLKLEKSKVFAEDLMDKKIDKEKLISVEKASSINQPLPINNLPERNRSFPLFNIDKIPENDWALLEDTDFIKDGHIKDLLKIGSPNADDICILIYNDSAKWKRYTKIIQENSNGEIQEFTVFYESKESPRLWIGEDSHEISLADVQKNLLTSFNSQRDIHFRDNDGICEVLILLVLAKNKGQGQIIGHYPLALASFSNK